jgi:small subunit ribosomal protein S24e
MDVKVLSSRENKVMGRKELEFVVVSESSPRSDEVRAELCKSNGISPELMVVVRIDSQYGSRTSRGIAHAYETKEALMRFESKHILKRLGLIEAGASKGEKAKAPKPGKHEAAKDEKPKEAGDKA